MGRKVGEFPSTEHLGEPTMTWKLLDKYKRGWGRAEKVIKIPLHRELLNPESDRELLENHNHSKQLLKSIL